MREKGTLLGKPAPEPVQLTAGPMNFLGPVPSKDGKKLFVVGWQRRAELARYDVKSEQFCRLCRGFRPTVRTSPRMDNGNLHKYSQGKPLEK